MNNEEYDREAFARRSQSNDYLNVMELLLRGSSSVDEIAQQAGLSEGRVWEILEDLKDHGCVDRTHLPEDN